MKPEDIDGPIYLSGPMTGLPEHNFPAFNDAAGVLRDCGFEVENPAENNDGKAGHPGGRAWYMRRDIERVLRSAAVALLPGWFKSQGALTELRIAQELGLPVFLYDPAAGYGMLFPVTVRIAVKVGALLREHQTDSQRPIHPEGQRPASEVQHGRGA